MTRKHPLYRLSKTNNNTDTISYAAMLTKDPTSYDLKNPTKIIIENKFHHFL